MESRIDMSTDVRIDMRRLDWQRPPMRVDMCMDLCIDMCSDTHMDMCRDMCIDVRILTGSAAQNDIVMPYIVMAYIVMAYTLTGSAAQNVDVCVGFSIHTTGTVHLMQLWPV